MARSHDNAPQAISYRLRFFILKGFKMALLPQRDIWEKFKISRPTLVEWVASGIITDYRTPKGHRRYDEDEILAALKQPGKDSSTGGPAVG